MNLSLLSDQIAQQDAIEWAGLITGLIYVILATYERPSCWIFGMISSACIGWKSLTDYFLIADVALQAFYIAISVIGLMQWIKGGAGHALKPIITHPVRTHISVIGICLLISWPVSWVLVKYADARYGYLDTVLTLLSVWGTILLIRKDLHNWIYWIVLDIIFVGLYWQSEGYLFALLFFVYTLISVWGWKKWKRHFQHQSPSHI